MNEKRDVTMQDLTSNGLHGISGSLPVEAKVNGELYQIIAAGPLTKQPGTVAFRVILVALDDKLAVWNQYFPDYAIDRPDFGRQYLEAGDYFRPVYIVQAVREFANRVSSKAPSIGSIAFRIPGTNVPDDAMNLD